MAGVADGENARSAGFGGLAGRRAAGRGMADRAVTGVAAAVMAGAAAVALLQLVAEVAGSPVPVVVVAVPVLTVAVVSSLLRLLRRGGAPR